MSWVDCILDVPLEVAEATRAFWAEVLGWRIGEPWPDHPEFASLQPPSGDSFVHVQVIDGPARLHLDLTVTDIETETQRLVGIGASAGTRTKDWQVLASPGGLPFCLLEEGGRRKSVPEATRWPSGHATRLVQVCIDAPERVHEQEIDFWSEVTGWAARPSDRPEFGGKLYPPDGPIRLLFQRLGADDPGETTRAHLDLATDDMATEVERVVALGATKVGPGYGWYALRDPAGMAFCVTGQSPY
jgi:catechol 2,3-dioxygenase-like lactoylglutathione lyase family enzyme